MKRRDLFRFAGISSACLMLPQITRAQAGQGPLSGPFLHGVASGDPLTDRVIIWTRLSAPKGVDNVPVKWTMSRDPGFKEVQSVGQTVASSERDFCVKVDVDNLEPGRSYFYRFDALGSQSRLGRTRTLPAGQVEQFTLAAVSCSNFPAGFFTVYRDIASRSDVDVLLHLGDYIYEYASDGYASHRAREFGRVSVPAWELIGLEDYRLRHAQYKSDPDLQAVHAAMPMIAIWDDHEVANDAWMDGAENHDSLTEGPWSERKNSGFRAYDEWMPIRSADLQTKGELFRSFKVGDLLSLHMLDTRFYGRAEQVKPLEHLQDVEQLERLRADPTRELLGADQLDWLRNSLRGCEARWQLIGQQVLVSELLLPDLSGVLNIEETRRRLGPELVDALLAMGGKGMPMMWDAWDGYPAARSRLVELLYREASSPVIITGDTHTGMAGNIPGPMRDRPVAVEMVTPSVSSPGFDEYFPTNGNNQLAPSFLAANPNLKYMETARRGWLRMTVTPHECHGYWHLANRVDQPNGHLGVDAHWVTAHREEPNFGLRRPGRTDAS